MTTVPVAPAPHELAAAAAAARGDLDHEQLLGALLGAHNAGMPQGQIWTTLAQIIARGENIHDLRNAIKAWQHANPPTPRKSPARPMPGAADPDPNAVRRIRAALDKASAKGANTNVTKLTITPTGVATACIEFNGTDIADAVRGLTVTMQANELPRVILDLDVFVEPIELDGPVITVPEQTVQALETLRWLSPDTRDALLTLATEMESLYAGQPMAHVGSRIRVAVGEPSTCACFACVPVNPEATR